jgi:hypothetical protein
VSKPKKKSDIIKELIKESRIEPTKVFDQLNEKSDQYLTKLLKVTKAL